MDLSPDEDNFQGRLLHQAALWDNVELLLELVASGADVNSRDGCGRTALHAAALAERSRCLLALCDAKADVDAQSDANTGGKTALHIAAERGHVENILALVAAGAALTARDAAGDCALALAERAGHRHAAHALRDARDALERERLSQHAQLRELLARGETQQLKAKLAALGTAAGIVANLTPNGANTLLYVASEAGLASAVSALLEAGADGRAHPVTKYCPLYIASYHGHIEIAKLLLAHFPQAVQQETVEKWLPLHAACIGGHANMITLLLEYPYPQHVLSTYTDPTGKWQYRAAFDVNARDVSGQTALYVACTLGNLAVLEALLNHTVACSPTSTPSEEPPPAPAEVLSPARSGISLGIHAIVNKLTGNKKDAAPDERRVRPVHVDACRGADSCVSCCARAGHVRCLRALLRAGAAASAPAHAPDAAQSPRCRRRSRSACAPRAAEPSPGRYSADRDAPWTALALAARAKNIQIVELLLQHGATDPHCRALRECARHGLADLVCALLATKAYPDPDYKLNKTTLSEAVFTGGGEAEGDATFRALCPTTAVLINWRELRAQLQHIRMSWIRAAALRVNSKLTATAAALHAVTRIDVSNNELRLLPPELFTMLSLRYLNAAQNKLERLPAATECGEEDRRKRGKKVQHNVYTARALQELYLQDNRLEELPDALFSLPALSTLDVSNNKLRRLPGAVWRAPALRDLNAALNHLRDLPTAECYNECGASPAESPQLSACSSLSSANFPFNPNAKSWSRSPSIEASESEADDEDAVPRVKDRAGNAVWSSCVRAHTWRGVVEPAAPARTLGASPLSSLNLAHNQFSCVPAALACLAPALTRLNMAYNSLRSMSFVTSYPTSLRQLDLSHNEISCWPSLPQVENFGSSEGDPLACYCIGGGGGGGRGGRPRSGGSVRSQLLSAACSAKRHLRLEGLRTLILANNVLTRIQLTTDDDGLAAAAPHDGSTDTDDDSDWGTGSVLRGRLLFPLLSMLDVSSNLLRCVPPHIHELTNLAVLNISGNKDITELPPTMGLLCRLWNLSCAGCALHEPLRSMLAGGKCRSMDVVGYLRSVLHEARHYTRLKLMIAGHQGIGKTSLLECLRQESAIQHRRKTTDHWAKRMGNKSSRRGNMSTVGVDIGTWIYEKQRSNRGPITFRTWDFGGQQEYYATHQYFLSRRSLYLVVWKVTDGRKGLAAALQWLRSIQARAPGSPVIMVATHYDQVANSNLPESESPEALQRVIRSGIMGAADADKLGLPRVMDSLEVSCSTRHNIRLLADIIYTVAFSIKPPGSKEPLLEQRVPATYLALEECVTSLAQESRSPVLRHDEYKTLVTQYMQQRGLRMFRDAAELHQATMFLHENGVLLHYDDATLKELYFLRPQWLCDVLAHVVTVREINPFASSGIMKIEDLAHVFKASPQLARGEEASGLLISLLNKFELALCWDARLLLVPPLLPAREPQQHQLPLNPRSWCSERGPPHRAWPLPLTTAMESQRGTDSPTLINDSCSNIIISGRSGSAPLRRLLLVSYVPCGFWARLMTRLLADNGLRTAAPTMYTPPPEMEVDDSISKALDLNWGWKLWSTGLKLVCGELTMLVVREIPAARDPLLGPLLGPTQETGVYRDLRLRVKQEGGWCELDMSSSACVEIQLPALTCTVRREDHSPIGGYQSISLEPNPETLAKLLALVSEHVDLLLEDWYPSLGTRFVHTSEGRCLITRVVPCPACLKELASDQPTHEHDYPLSQALRRLELDGCTPREAAGAAGAAGAEAPVEARPPRLSAESRASDGDSGVGAESNASSRLGSVEGIVGGSRVATAWSVEECILCACTGGQPVCSHHAVNLRDMAPDLLLLDVEESMRARWEQVTRGAVCGRGAFGTVLQAVWRRPGQPDCKVAVKALQPVPPPAPTDLQAHHAYKAAISRWERDPWSAACRAYCGVRQELSILRQLRHPHVLPLLCVCAAPLALLLPLAPQGALDGVLRNYRGCGCRVGPRALRAAALQLARALEYLHARRVVYRDLKSENVLVWAMPKPQEAAAAELNPAPIDVHIKLADYGISRLAPPSGTKGFGGTEGFMAPEIMRYNGEEEYNEKVDCFSYGMVVYEMVSLRAPFEGHEAVKEAVLDGARPTLSPRDLEYPCCILEMMRRCWAGAPGLRPSAAALVAACSAPELPALQDAAAARMAGAAVAVPVDTEEGGGWEVWYAGEAERVHALLCTPAAFTHHHTVRIPPVKTEPVTVTALCRVGPRVWLGDSAGRVAVYSISTCALQWSVVVAEAVGGAPSSVAALQPLPTLQRLALALTCGRLFLVTSARPEAEGSFVLTELGCATELCCLAAVATSQGWEVWAGGDGLYAYGVCASGVCGADTLPLPAPQGTQGVKTASTDQGDRDVKEVQQRVTLLAAAAGEPYVFAFCDPGVCVYQYSVSTKQQTARLDCSKLAPCSESLQTISIEHRDPHACRVTAMCSFSGCVYAGTAWGCLVVADAATLRPLTVFRPYEENVSAILPLPAHPGAGAGVLLATLGAGYRPLLNRYVPQQSNNNNPSYSGPYCLLWRAQHWLPD